MKYKAVMYALFPLLGLGLLGTGVASAHGWFGGFGAVSPDEIAARHQAMFDGQAKILGVDVADLKNAWAEGKSIPELMKEKGITAEQVQARAKSAATDRMKAELKALADKGIITQAHADKRLAVMQDKTENGRGRMGMGMGMGMKFHRGWFKF